MKSVVIEHYILFLIILCFIPSYLLCIPITGNEIYLKWNMAAQHAFFSASIVKHWYSYRGIIRFCLSGFLQTGNLIYFTNGCQKQVVNTVLLLWSIEPINTNIRTFLFQAKSGGFFLQSVTIIRWIQYQLS